jgi:hypothetical protein
MKRAGTDEVVLLVGERVATATWISTWLEQDPARHRKQVRRLRRARDPKDSLVLVPGPLVRVVVVSAVQPVERYLATHLQARGFQVENVAPPEPRLPPCTRRQRTGSCAPAAEAQECRTSTHSPTAREHLWDRVFEALVASAGVSAAPPGQSTSSTDESIGGRRPAGEAVTVEAGAKPGNGDAAHWLDQYAAYDGHWDEHHEKCRVIREAGWHLASLTNAPTHDPRGLRLERSEETAEEFAERVLCDGAGWPLAEVACHFRTTERIAARIRRDDGRDTETGMNLPGEGERATPGRPRGDSAEAGAAADTRRYRARRMRDEGKAIRAIALILQVDASTISRDLRHSTDLRRAA